MKTTIIKNIGCGLLLLSVTACTDYLEKSPSTSLLLNKYGKIRN